jgi:hypothetical protein
MRGKSLGLSAPRRLVCDLMHFSVFIPRVAVQRRMNLSPLRNVRQIMTQRPSWMAIFLKGYGLLAEETPELRRAYVKLPWPHIYEYPVSIASVAHEREVNGERAVLLSRIKAPEHRSLQELAGLLHDARTLPVRDIKDFRRALALARFPTSIRRLVMWLGLNVARQRANYFGTFQLSVYSGLGAESFNPLTPLSTFLNYGEIDESGGVNVRINYDHRVMDGADVARALAKLEGILNGTIVEELERLSEDALDQSGDGPYGSQAPATR